MSSASTSGTSLAFGLLQARQTDAWRPCWDQDARHRRDDANGRLLVWHERSGERLSLDAPSEAVWRACDGAQSVDIIARARAERDGIRRDVVLDALRRLSAAGMLAPATALEAGIRGNTVCVVSERHQFVYLTTTKNASSTLKARLTEPDYGGIVRARASVEGRVWTGFFTFGFLRDPVARLLSAYEEISMRLRREQAAHHRFATMPRGRARFLAFLEELESDGAWEEHAAPQAAFFAGRRVDYWGHVETLDRDLAEIHARLGLAPPKPLPQLHVSADLERPAGSRPLAVADLDDAIVARIHRLYQEDLALIAAKRPDRVRPAAVEAAIQLVDGSVHRLELPDGDAALERLRALAAGESDARTGLLQLPLAGGRSALTVAGADVRGVTLTPRAPSVA